jgi:hypothetical protein
MTETKLYALHSGAGWLMDFDILDGPCWSDDDDLPDQLWRTVSKERAEQMVALCRKDIHKHTGVDDADDPDDGWMNEIEIIAFTPEAT